MEMVHHQDVAVELSTRLLTAQHEIETLCASDTDTWTATSSVQSSGKEPAVGSHSPSGSHSR
jgi:hypothetical protein